MTCGHDDSTINIVMGIIIIIIIIIKCSAEVLPALSKSESLFQRLADA